MTPELDTTHLFAIAAALGWASGLRLYAVVFLTGNLARYRLSCVLRAHLLA